MQRCQRTSAVALSVAVYAASATMAAVDPFVDREFHFHARARTAGDAGSQVVPLYETDGCCAISASTQFSSTVTTSYSQAGTAGGQLTVNSRSTVSGGASSNFDLFAVGASGGTAGIAYHTIPESSPTIADVRFYIRVSNPTVSPGRASGGEVSAFGVKSHSTAVNFDGGRFAREERGLPVRDGGGVRVESGSSAGADCNGSPGSPCSFPTAATYSSITAIWRFDNLPWPGETYETSIIQSDSPEALAVPVPELVPDSLILRNAGSVFIAVDEASQYTYFKAVDGFTPLPDGGGSSEFYFEVESDSGITSVLFPEIPGNTEGLRVYDGQDYHPVVPGEEVEFSEAIDAFSLVGVDPAIGIPAGQRFPYSFGLLFSSAGWVDVRSAAFGLDLPGDFNFDGEVNAADYTVWRDSLGVSPTYLSYSDWVANYGASSDLPPNARGIPAPTAASLAALVCVGMLGRRRRSIASAVAPG